MTIQDVTRLLDAGFSKEEILSLVKDPAASTEQKQEPEKEKPAEQEKEQNQEQEKEQNQEQKQEPEKKDPSADPETEKRLSSIEASINSLVKAIQKQNLLNDHMDSNNETLEQQTDEIMKSIIRPEQKRKDDK